MRVLALALAEATWTCLRDPTFHLPALSRLTAEGASGIAVAPQPLIGDRLWSAATAPIETLLSEAGVPWSVTKSPTDESVDAIERRINAVISDLAGGSRFVLARVTEVSRVQHRHWGDPSVRTIYEAVDRTLARLIEAAGPDTILFIFSECGAGPLRHGVQLNAWLEREGFLHRRPLPSARTAVSLVRAYRLLPASLRRWLHRRVPAAKSRAKTAMLSADIDWSRTRALAHAATGEIVLKTDVAAEVRERLLALRDPEGRRVVEDVIAGDGILQVVWDDDAYAPCENLATPNEVFVEWRIDGREAPYAGCHRREGLVIVHGPGVTSTDLGRIATTDFVPTWLDLLGVPIPDEIKGRSFAGRLGTHGQPGSDRETVRRVAWTDRASPAALSVIEPAATT